MMTMLKNMMNEAIDATVECFRRGNKLLLCGNGGSAADCAHITGELVKGFLKKRLLSAALLDAISEPWAKRLQQGLPAIDMTVNNALMTAVINDIDGESVFAQQVTAYGKAGDILIGLSTSGNAENVRRAMVTGRAMGLTTIGFTGKTGGCLRECCDILFHVDEQETYRVQEEHIKLYHEYCKRVEAAIFEE